MKKIVKPLIILLSICVALVLIPIVIFISIDLNNYKQEIESLVQESTGRELKLEGELNKSVFPWLGIDIGVVRLSNAAGFTPKYFASLQQVQVKIALLPLLQQRIKINDIILHGLSVNLAVNKKGVTNWDDLTTSATNSPADPSTELTTQSQTTATQKDTDGKGTSSQILKSLVIGGIDIRDANIIWDDQQNNSRVEVTDFGLNTGVIQSGQPIVTQFSLNVSSNQVKAKTRLEWQGNILLDLDAQQIQVADMLLSLQTKGEDVPVPAKQLEMNLSANIDLDFNEPSKLAVDGLKITLDDTTVTGNATINNLAQPSIRYQLAVDKIDVDRYLPPTVEAADTPAVKTTAAGKATPLALDPLRQLDVQGTLTVGHLTAAKLIVESVVLDLNAKDGKIRLHPLTAQFYDGKIDGDVVLDVRTDTPKIKLIKTIKGVNVKPVMQALADNDKLTGKVGLTASLTATGLEVSEIKQSLNGKASFIFSDGAIKDFDLGQKVRDAYETLRKKKLPPSSSPGQTNFAEVKGSAVIKNGIVHNNDLSAKSPALRVSGKGVVDLPKETIDYHLNATLVKSAEGQSGEEMAELTGVTIPVNIAGTFSEPKVKVDIKAALKSGAKQAIAKEKQKVKEKITEQREEKKQELKEKAVDKLKDKLKGLFR